jgi:hypothetical protein
LAALGWSLRTTDIVAFPGALPKEVMFELVDLENRDAVHRLADGCGLILHFGGVSTEQSFEAILGLNIRGSFHIYEAARREATRVVFPSSVHAVGLYEGTFPGRWRQRGPFSSRHRRQQIWSLRRSPQPGDAINEVLRRSDDRGRTEAILTVDSPPLPIMTGKKKRVVRYIARTLSDRERKRVFVAVEGRDVMHKTGAIEQCVRRGN